MDTEELTPGKGGADCLYNGLHEGYECACDECDFYLECYPDWRKFGEYREFRILPTVDSNFPARMV